MNTFLFLGKMGSTEILILFLVFVILIGLPILCYQLGKKAGYRQGQLDMYKKMEDEKRKS